MARIGLKYFRYGILNEDTEKYDGALQIGKAIDCKVSLDLNSAELYADDGLAESDYSVKKGTVSITVDEDDDQTMSNLTGHEISDDGEIIRKDTDTPPYVRFWKNYNESSRWSIQIQSRIFMQSKIQRCST